MTLPTPLPTGGLPTPGDPHRPAPPTLTNGATVHGFGGDMRMRHPWELPLLIVGASFTTLAYLTWAGLLVYAIVLVTTGRGASIENAIGEASVVAQLVALLMALPFLIWIARALMYAQLRVQSVRMSPTQFPEGYRMVAESAHQFGLRRVPDAYVVLGNGVINAFAAGHGFRRFVAINSDLFEVGGAVRDPDALRFVIGHEVGHIAAGHVSYLRLVFTNLLAQVPLLGTAYSRSQEYTADNFGYLHAPAGAPGVMATLAAGKYLNANVNVNELADRAAHEKGLWVHIANWQSSHPVTTWRSHALRDRRRPGHLWFRPGLRGTPGASYIGPLPPGSDDSLQYPTPADALILLDRAAAERPPGFDQQFGRFPGVDYGSRPTLREMQLSAPLLSRVWLPAAPPVAPSQPVPPSQPTPQGQPAPQGQTAPPNQPAEGQAPDGRQEPPPGPPPPPPPSR
ncbi:M48 family metallopeptidase [Microlunatus aurantiacus]|uniref:M48 family metallopeptidase n=1 Tax=Microlunatus aurantiacus TaxID=446786 RepID=A0ABP7EK55_9ACTN